MGHQVQCQAHLPVPQQNYPEAKAQGTTHYPASQAQMTMRRNTCWAGRGLVVLGWALKTEVLPGLESWVLPAAYSYVVGGFGVLSAQVPAVAQD